MQENAERQEIKGVLKDGPLLLSEIKQALKDQRCGVSQNSVAVILRKMLGEGDLEQAKRRGPYSLPRWTHKEANKGVGKAMRRKAKEDA